ncbi:hypothetical protein SFR_4613 [Streptomyces sp. FR-008]|nr:hypothetical protein SFR_4613 [Streptomyces sp. FR-008]
MRLRDRERNAERYGPHVVLLSFEGGGAVPCRTAPPSGAGTAAPAGSGTLQCLAGTRPSRS